MADKRIPLLLHACCGPCSLEPLRILREEGFEPTICWVNPNIQPDAEHDLRLATLLAWARDVARVDVIVGPCERDKWERSVAPSGLDRPERCRSCYALRLSRACRIARDRGFTHVSTTLAVSPHQLYDVCMEMLVRMAESYDLIPVVRDYRELYEGAYEHARELGMYTQSYCGCRFSALEAAVDRHAARDERKAARAASRHVG